MRSVFLLIWYVAARHEAAAPWKHGVSSVVPAAPSARFWELPCCQQSSVHPVSGNQVIPINVACVVYWDGVVQVKHEETLDHSDPNLVRITGFDFFLLYSLGMSSWMWDATASNSHKRDHPNEEEHWDWRRCWHRLDQIKICVFKAWRKD